jgi:NTE family protein
VAPDHHGPRKPKIAIACQGGGSQTAFTSGALKTLLEARAHDSFEVVSLSGTCGGAIRAALAWHALRKRDPAPWRRLAAFWAENTAQSPAEEVFNYFAVGWLRAVGSGHVPMLQRSPSSAGMQMAMGAAARAFPPISPTSAPCSRRTSTSRRCDAGGGRASSAGCSWSAR